MATVADLIRAVLRDGDEQGVRFVLKRHVTPGVFAELADATHAHAWTHGVEDVPDWRVYHDGILSWWSAEAGLDAEGERRLHKFRNDIVAWLSERGFAERHHPRATPLRVRRR